MGITFETVWQRIVEHAGEQFQSKTGQVFRYEVIDNSKIKPTHADVEVDREALAKYFHKSGGDTSKIAVLSGGPSFIWSILNDPRIGGQKQ